METPQKYCENIIKILDMKFCEIFKKENLDLKSFETLVQDIKGRLNFQADISLVLFLIGHEIDNAFCLVDYTEENKSSFSFAKLFLQTDSLTTILYYSPFQHSKQDGDVFSLHLKFQSIA